MNTETPMTAAPSLQRKPWYQRVILAFTSIILGATTLGALVAAVRDAAGIIPPMVTYGGTIAAVIFWISGSIILRRKPLLWISARGESTLLKRLGFRSLFVTMGAVGLLWTPRAMPAPVEKGSEKPAPHAHAAPPPSPPHDEPSTPLGPRYFEVGDDRKIPSADPLVVALAASAHCTTPMSGGVRAGLDAFLICLDLDHGSYKAYIAHDRSEANLEPLIITSDFEASSGKYERIFAGQDQALVLWDYQGSGEFLTIHILLWRSGKYADLAQSVDEKPGAFFAFADLDLDGTKELVIFHDRKAIDKTTELFAFDKTLDTYVKLQPSSLRYRTLIREAAAIREGAPPPDNEENGPWLVLPPSLK
jgi:hypothetical protein